MLTANENGDKTVCDDSAAEAAYAATLARCINERFTFVPMDAVGPRALQVQVTPAEPRAGSTATLTCVADTSNPAPHVTWWTESGDGRLGARLETVGEGESQTAAEYGGSVVVSRVDVQLDIDDDGKRVACVANGTRTAVKHIQLRVRCKSQCLSLSGVAGPLAARGGGQLCRPVVLRRENWRMSRGELE